MRPIDQGFEMSLVHRGGGIGQPSDPPGAEDKYTDPVLFRNGQAGADARAIAPTSISARRMKWADKRGAAKQAVLPLSADELPARPVRRRAAGRSTRITSSRRSSADTFPKIAGNPIPRNMDADTQARVYAMIENVDHNVGRLLKWLDEQKLAENTLVIFMTDNGRATPGYNAGLRGNKSTVYEGGIRSPFFAYWPGTLQPGVASDRIAAHIDITPTILRNLRRRRRRPDLKLDGRSLWPLLTGLQIAWPERTLFTQGHRGDEPVLYHNFAARNQKWKLVSATGFGPETAARRAGRSSSCSTWRATPTSSTTWPPSIPRSSPSSRANTKPGSRTSAARGRTTTPRRAIIVGSPHEKTTVLTRQDWRGAGWGPNDEGHWLIDVATPAAYDVKLIVAPADGRAHAAPAKSASLEATATLAAKATEHTFARQNAAHRQSKARSLAREQRQRTGVRFVEDQPSAQLSATPATSSPPSPRTDAAGRRGCGRLRAASARWAECSSLLAVVDRDASAGCRT